MVNNHYLYLITPSAKKDIKSIYEYISVILNNPVSAQKLISKFLKVFESLTMFPKRFPVVNNGFIKEKEIRRINIDSYSVFYRVKEKKIEILRVIYSKLNIIEILKKVN